ncbi:MAG: ribosome-associated translation inhibitor RaiA [Bryobacteraceae bacterium]|nr:ribosome-associated translation inhibitor RaiA [Bryobacteraceae bacterium]
MNISYHGKQEVLHPKQREQLDGKLARITRLLETDGKGDKQARVALHHDRNVHRAEITLNYLDHTVVGEHLDEDQFTALCLAVERLERQMMRLRDKRRDVKKGPREDWDKLASTDSLLEAEPRSSNGINLKNGDGGKLEGLAKREVFRVRPEDNKPYTEEEAVLIIGDDPYLVYQNSGTGRLACLIRRQDGDFDLVEC